MFDDNFVTKPNWEINFGWMKAYQFVDPISVVLNVDCKEKAFSNE